MTRQTPEALTGWLANRLAEGQSMARGVGRMMDRLPGRVSLIAGVQPSSPDLRWGQGAQQDSQLLITRLASDWPAATVVVELPLVNPGDPWIGDDLGILTCGTEVYAQAPISGGREKLSAALRAHDPSSLYVAAALMLAPGRSALDCPTKALEEGSASPVAMIVGAYDGEAFVYWSAEAREAR